MKTRNAFLPIAAAAALASTAASAQTTPRYNAESVTAGAVIVDEVSGAVTICLSGHTTGHVAPYISPTASCKLLGTVSASAQAQSLVISVYNDADSALVTNIYTGAVYECVWTVNGAVGSGTTGQCAKIATAS